MKTLVLFISMAVLLCSAQAAVAIRFSHDAEGNIPNRSIKLDFAISETGVVSLDASTQSGNPLAAAAVDKWDNDNIATVEEQALYGKSFSLQSFTENEKGGFPPLILRPEEGGILGIGGHNPGRIDGTGLKSGPNKETLSWVLSGGVKLVIVNFACGLGVNNSGIIVEDADSELRTGPMKKNQAANWDIPRGMLTLEDGERLVFKADPDLMQGAGLVGFVFDIESSE
jgi:hypothetical protein